MSIQIRQSYRIQGLLMSMQLVDHTFISLLFEKRASIIKSFTWEKSGWATGPLYFLLEDFVQAASLDAIQELACGSLNQRDWNWWILNSRWGKRVVFFVFLSTRQAV